MKKRKKIEESLPTYRTLQSSKKKKKHCSKSTFYYIYCILLLIYHNTLKFSLKICHQA